VLGYTVTVSTGSVTYTVESCVIGVGTTSAGPVDSVTIAVRVSVLITTKEVCVTKIVEDSGVGVDVPIVVKEVSVVKLVGSSKVEVTVS
jgi:uncharacterized metal-binding protein